MYILNDVSYMFHGLTLRLGVLQWDDGRRYDGGFGVTANLISPNRRWNHQTLPSGYD